MFTHNLPSIVKLPKSKKFEFIPRFYDPLKEELENRKEEINTESERKNILFNYRKNNYKSKQEYNNFLKRFTIILTILLAIAYWMLH